MHLVVLGDIGTPGAYHAGDESMAAAAVQELQRRGPCHVVAISADPSSTTARHGWTALPRTGYAGLSTDAQRDARLAAVVAAAEGQTDALAPDDPAWGVIRAVAAADAVLITGGGNLNSSWPEHVYERATLAGLARRSGRPLVVTGQTIGPHLTGRHGELVGAVVTSAALVGVREEASYEVCRALGVPPERLTVTVDDASFVTEQVPGWEPPAQPYVAATFASHSGALPRDGYVAHLAALVQHAQSLVDGPVVLVPHEGPLDSSGGDVALHDAIREATGNPEVVSLPITPGTEAAVARGAALVLSTRYHPAVYAAAGGVPAVAIATDAYTSAKLGGAMRNMGLGDVVFGIPSLLSGAVQQAVTELWSHRAEAAENLAALASDRRAHASTWWDAVAEALHGTQPAAPRSLEPAASATPTLVAPSTAADDWAAAADARAMAASLAATAVRERLGLAEARVRALEGEVASLRAELARAARDATSATLSRW